MPFSDRDCAPWIGRKSERSDAITERMLMQFRATLAPWLAEAEVPPGLHWCLCPDALAATDLGRDGHARTGLHLPALPLPRRMWAGGTLKIHDAFHAGDVVTRRSGVDSIACKQGRTGPLGFVAVRHEYRVDGRLILDEVQDIVFREDPRAGDTPPVPPSAPDLGEPLRRLELTPDPVLLFRFSAITFNGHRIHFDHPYATGVEGYDGLVVHGPMQAVLMLNLAVQIMGRMPGRFRYRGVSPLTVGKPIIVEAHAAEDALSLRIRIAGGAVTMTGTAES
jgi:3-methylfumaryl-CoA hydratase